MLFLRVALAVSVSAVSQGGMAVSVSAVSERPQ